MSAFNDESVTVYQRIGTGKPRRAYVALIERGGDLGPHTSSLTFGTTEAEARQKAADAIVAFDNPEKRHKQPTDLITVREAPGPLSDADALSD